MSEMTAEQYAEAQAKEYGKYVAKEPIDLGGARAFNTGDPVPVGHVERGVVREDQVAGTNTKAAAAAKES
jgi:hypothetical protein